MNASDRSKLIVAFLAQGRAHEVAVALHGQLGIDAVHYGRGRDAGMLPMASTRDLVEIDLLSVVVDASRADEVFAFVYRAGGIGEPGGGMVMQMPLARAAAVPLPVLEPPAGA